MSPCRQNNIYNLSEGFIYTAQSLCIGIANIKLGVLHGTNFVVRTTITELPYHSIFKHGKYASFYECGASQAESRRIARPTALQHLHTAWLNPVCAAERHLWSAQGLQALR